MSLSRVVSAGKRRHDLGTLFVNLLQDESRWVRMAAFQALGPFISTFSKDEDFEAVTAASAAPSADSSIEEEGSDFNTFHYWRDPIPDVEINPSVEKTLETLMASVELTDPATTPSDIQHAFDLRRVTCQELLPGDPNPPPPPPTLPEPEPMALLPPAYTKTANSTSDIQQLPTTVYSNSFYSYYSNHRRRLSDGGLSSGNISMEAPVRPRPYSPLQPGQQRPDGLANQTVVPQNLMDYYLQMTDPYFVETVDAEITRHCAYSLPAVVCTLGREHWPLLRDLYSTLASDMQWKVRRTLAASIHEIGAILGQDVVTADLLPVFDGFIKDLDEVRIGVLKHLTDFLRLLPDRERRSYLPRLADFLKLDNEQNWRFRQELAIQLQSVVALYNPSDSAQFILPLALTLASDRVAAVRLPAFTLVIFLNFFFIIKEF